MKKKKPWIMAIELAVILLLAVGKEHTAGPAPLCPWETHGQDALWKPLKARKLL